MIATIPIKNCSALSLLKTIVDPRNGATYFPELGLPPGQSFTCRAKFDFCERYFYQQPTSDMVSDQLKPDDPLENVLAFQDNCHKTFFVQTFTKLECLTPAGNINLV